MTRLEARIGHVLSESRILVLGAQLLVGIQYKAILERGFDALPLVSRLLNLLVLFVMLAAVALLLAPTAYHRIVERGEDTEELHAYATRLMKLALLPFALALGLALYIASERIVGVRFGIVIAAATSTVALFFWYILELVRRRDRREEVREVRETEAREAAAQSQQGPDARAKLKDKINHVLTETRVVLPGAQALLGFQFITILSESFERLPAAAQYVHLLSLLLIALTVILLMTPAAYHRIVEEGEDTEHFHRFASRMVVAALVPLALGTCGDVYVVVRKVLDSQLVAVVAALVILALFWELWFGITIYRRTQRDHAA